RDFLLAAQPLAHWPSRGYSWGRVSPPTRPVLVVDDHTDSRLMMMELLEHVGGFRTLGAANGIEALRLLREQRPCVILLDLTMPHMNGWEFRERQQQLEDRDLAQVPVIIMSALPDCEEHAR